LLNNWEKEKIVGVEESISDKIMVMAQDEFSEKERETDFC
jgi:hypothetical protein